MRYKGLVPAITGLILVLNGCINTGPLSTELAQSNLIIQSSLDRLTAESAEWRAMLEAALEDLPEDVQSTIRNEIELVVLRTIAAGGAEFRCDVDFLRLRLEQDIERVVSEIQGENDVPQPAPVICMTTPSVVDMNLSQERRNKIDIFGYGFKDAPLSAYIRQYDGSELDMTFLVFANSDYHLVLDLSRTEGVVYDHTRDILISSGGDALASIPIIRTEMYESCDQQTVNVVPGQKSYIPPNMGGDDEFGGNGPKVRAWFKYQVSPDRRRLSGKVYMSAAEYDDGDWGDSKAWGESGWFVVFDADADGMDSKWVIKSIGVDIYDAVGYVDQDHDDDIFSEAGRSPVETWVFVGDTDGDDIGETRVNVDLRPFELILEGC